MMRWSRATVRTAPTSSSACPTKTWSPTETLNEWVAMLDVSTRTGEFASSVAFGVDQVRARADEQSRHLVVIGERDEDFARGAPTDRVTPLGAMLAKPRMREILAQLLEHVVGHQLGR